MTQLAAIRCSEVWGGNQAASSRLVLPGLQGCLISRPYHDAKGGGDVHLLSSCGTGRITRLMLADISGHGDQVAKVGQRLRRVMQRYMNHISPHKIARSMNRDMSEIAGDSGRFATAVILTYFSPDGSLNLCNAGHPSPLLYRRRLDQWSAIDQPGEANAIRNLPLGVLEEAGFVGHESSLEPGDVLIVYTDALNEARHPERGDLSIEGLLEIVQNWANADSPTHDPTNCGIPDLALGLIDRIKDEGYELDDDLTIVTLRCTGESQGRKGAAVAGGTWRALGTFFNRKPVPWPELSWKNIAGALFGSKRTPASEV